MITIGCSIKYFNLKHNIVRYVLNPKPSAYIEKEFIKTIYK
ncbi:hypothetical protein [Campylobacter canadensis]|nr:hypothetical protein [Campylobacter canadensis]